MIVKDKLGVIIVPILLGIVLIAVASLNPVYVSANNIWNILLQASILGIISLGMTVVIISGGIDLSVGALVALSGIVLAKAITAGVPDAIAVILTISVGLTCGMAMGGLVAFFGVPSFIVTLGMMGIARGGALALSDGRPMSDIGWISATLGSSTIAGVPTPILLFLCTGAIFHLFFTRTIWGTRLYAIGGNARAAWIAGVHIKRYVASAYAVSGLLAALAGIVLAGRLGSAQPLAGVLYELDAITAAVLGGAALTGGRGSALGSAAGVILLAALRNAMVIVNLSPYYHQVVIGVVLIAVLLSNSIGQGRNKNAF